MGICPSRPSTSGVSNRVADGQEPVELRTVQPSSQPAMATLPTIIARPVPSSSTMHRKIFGALQKIRRASQGRPRGNTSFSGFDEVPKSMCLTVETFNEFESIDEAARQAMHLLEFRSHAFDAKVWNEEVKNRLNAFPKFQFLVLNECAGLNTDSLAGLPAIRHLRVKDSTWDQKPASWDMLPRALVTLDISGMNVTSLRGLPQLRTLDVSGCRFDESLLMDLPRTIESLSLANCDVTNHGLNAVLQHLPNLREVNVFMCNGLDDTVKAGLNQAVTFNGLLNRQDGASVRSAVPGAAFSPSAISLPGL